MAWKRLLAVGCSHGHLADKTALDAVLRFKRRWKPHFTIHLGDFLDMTAFRAGAAGTNDESADPRPDVSSGLVFLDRLRPNVILCGNHEDRLWRLRNSQKAIIATLSDCIIREIETVAKGCKAKIVPYVYKQAFDLADIRFMHGALWNEQCVRDTAEAYAPPNGAVVFAHSHRAGMSRGRRSDGPLGFNTGTLIDIKQAEYAKVRRATLGWSQGFVWGVFNEERKQSTLWLHDEGQRGQWHLPM